MSVRLKITLCDTEPRHSGVESKSGINYTQGPAHHHPGQHGRENYHLYQFHVVTRDNGPGDG